MTAFHFTRWGATLTHYSLGEFTLSTQRSHSGGSEPVIQIWVSSRTEKGYHGRISALAATPHTPLNVLRKSAGYVKARVHFTQTTAPQSAVNIWRA